MTDQPTDPDPDAGEAAAAVAEEPPRAWRRIPWQAIAALAVALAFVALLVFGLKTQAPNDRIDAGLAVQKPVAAPSIDLEALVNGDPGAALGARWAQAAADRRVRLSELRGVPLVVNFWASWCDPCRREAATLEHGWRRTRDAGVLYLGINQQDARGDARGFVREHKLDYPSLREGQDDTSKRWGVTGYPETFFISARGRVVAHVIGIVSERQLREGTAAARHDAPLGTTSGGSQGATR